MASTSNSRMWVLGPKRGPEEACQGLRTATDLCTDAVRMGIVEALWAGSDECRTEHNGNRKTHPKDYLI